MKETGNLIINTPTDREIEIVRVFDAPRALVYEAYTKPELLKKWLGVFGGWSMPVCEVDLRVGGSYRWVWRNVNGQEMGIRGVYREIVPATRIVCTEVFDEAWYEGEAVDTVEFVERNGRTTLTTTILYVSKEARDGVLKSPMDQGMAQSFDKLAALLAKSA